MKKFSRGCLFALAIVLTSVAVYAQEVKPNRPELILPARIYAVPGIETNVYFANIARTINPANFDFDVDSPKGRNDAARWRFTPTAQDVGTFSWSLTVRNDDGPTAVASAELVVTPLDAAKDKSISWLHIGDSISASGAVSGRVREWAQKYGPKIKNIGTYTRDGKPLPAVVVNRHEGRPGWTSGTFLSNRSPFFFDGKIDFKKYLAKEN
ncbi:MAG: PKD domain-containing protein, partial [Planctomycetia bacterium]|nr:PKD domain-containing protein [Planctomycetia bacterium]